MTPRTGQDPLESTHPRIRLRPSASVTPTGAGVILRSDLGTFQITGPDASAFLQRMAPLLDGSRSEEELIQALAGYSRASVTAFLGLLKKRGLVEAVPVGAARFRGPEEFFRAWSASPPDAMQRVTQARVLVAGLEPWGAAAAIELAAAGIAAIHLLDDGVVGPEDAALLRARGGAALGAPRREVLAAWISEQAPWCHVDQGPTEALGADAQMASGPWTLLLAAILPVDAARIANVARFAQRASVGSLWSHLAGTKMILGPLVTPGETACRICATVEALNPPLAEPGRCAPASQSPAIGQLLGHMVAMEALQVISAYTPSELGGRLLIEDVTTHETSFHTLVRFPSCPVCRDGGEVPAPGHAPRSRSA